MTTPAPKDPVSALARKVAHELNSPLDGVMRFVALAQRKVKDGQYADIERYLADAEFGLQRMAEILRELTDVRPAPLAEPTAQKLPLADVLTQAVRTLAPLAQANHVHVHVAPPPPVQVDPHLYQVVTNLLKNAAQAMPHGGTATVQADATDNTLTLRVLDTGPGIAPHHQHRLFEPFFTTKPSTQGMGLGLALCRDIVTKLGGSITLRNRQDFQGCEAVVVVPHT
jgi:signal transduction histidine kinase